MCVYIHLLVRSDIISLEEAMNLCRKFTVRKYYAYFPLCDCECIYDQNLFGKSNNYFQK